jgi:hypothetical protein
LGSVEYHIIARATARHTVADQLKAVISVAAAEIEILAAAAEDVIAPFAVCDKIAGAFCKDEVIAGAAVHRNAAYAVNTNHVIARARVYCSPFGIRVCKDHIITSEAVCDLTSGCRQAVSFIGACVALGREVWIHRVNRRYGIHRRYGNNWHYGIYRWDQVNRRDRNNGWYGIYRWNRINRNSWRNRLNGFNWLHFRVIVIRVHKDGQHKGKSQQGYKCKCRHFGEISGGVDNQSRIT